MTNGIPVTLYLDRATFIALEESAERSGSTVRELMIAAARHVMGTEQFTRGGRKRRYSASDVDAWVAASRTGISNQTIAERYGVSEATVSRRLCERGQRSYQTKGTK